MSSVGTIWVESAENSAYARDVAGCGDKQQLAATLTLSGVACQAVLAAVKLLCMRFPTVKYHAGTAMLAVGGLPSLAPSPNEPIAVYDMDTGIKKRSLRCRFATSSECQPQSEANAGLRQSC